MKIEQKAKAYDEAIRKARRAEARSQLSKV